MLKCCDTNYEGPEFSRNLHKKTEIPGMKRLF